MKKTYEIANFGTRLGALFIDLLIIIILGIFSAGKIIPLLKQFTNSEKDMEFDVFVGIVIFYIIGIPLIGILYRSLFEFSKFQGTPGKIIVGIKVVCADFKRISFTKALLRNFVKIFSGLLFYIGYLIALRDSKCLTWHDLAAKTYVIRLRKESNMIIESS